jgi:hypothetical protein
MVDAPDPDYHGMVPTSTSYIYKVFVIILMFWMCSGFRHNAITITFVIVPSWGSPIDVFV